MGKVLKVTSRKQNASILRDTVAKAQKTIHKKTEGKVNKLKREEKVKPVEKAESSDDRKQRKINEKKLRKEKYHKELGVLQVSHIPHGFYEEQLEKFYSQFGRIKRVRLVRSTISGRSKGYAFIVFRFKEVADIAAETTNNYLMGKRILKAKVIPSDEVKGKWFYHSTPKNIKFTLRSKRREKNIKIVNKKLTHEEGIKRLNAQKKTLQKMVKKLLKKGIDYKYNAV